MSLLFNEKKQILNKKMYNFFYTKCTHFVHNTHTEVCKIVWNIDNNDLNKAVYTYKVSFLK